MLRDLKPTDNVGGFDVRPGNFLLNGATTVSAISINFTVHFDFCFSILYRYNEFIINVDTGGHDSFN